MKRYMIETPHTTKECVKAMDDVMSLGPDVLSRYVWGCKEGEHIGWAMIEGNDLADAEKAIPESMKEKTMVVEVEPFTAQDIISMHKEEM